MAVPFHVLEQRSPQRHVQELVAAAHRQDGQAPLQRLTEETQLVGVAGPVGPLRLRVPPLPVQARVDVPAPGQQQAGRVRGQVRPVHYQRLAPGLTQRVVVVLRPLEGGRPPVGNGDAGDHLITDAKGMNGPPSKRGAT